MLQLTQEQLTPRVVLFCYRTLYILPNNITYITSYFEGSGIIYVFSDDKIYLILVQAYQTSKGLLDMLCCLFPSQANLPNGAAMDI